MAGPIAAGRADAAAYLRDKIRPFVLRRLKCDVAIYVLGMAALTGVWALVEWNDNGAFERFSTGNNPGDWEPWILFVALIWGFFLALDALKTYFDRPTTETDVDRQIERLRSR